jgi:hypothetical protein
VIAHFDGIVFDSPFTGMQKHYPEGLKQLFLDLAAAIKELYPTKPLIFSVPKALDQDPAWLKKL